MIGEDYLRRDLWPSIFCDTCGLWTDVHEKIDVLLDFEIQKVKYMDFSRQLIHSTSDFRPTDMINVIQKIAKCKKERAHRAGESRVLFSASLRSTDRSGKGV